jgi:sugar/nucleoside kinase (ribokinase family)
MLGEDLIRSYEILVIGDLCLDIDIKPGRRSRQVEIERIAIIPSGSAGNTAITLKALEPSAGVALLYPSSGDHIDHILKNLASRTGVEVIGIPGNGTACVVVNIVSSRGSRRAYTTKGPRISRLEIPDIDLTGSRIAHLSGYIMELAPYTEILEFIRRMRADTTVSIDLFPRISEIPWSIVSEIIRKTNIVFGNTRELSSIGGGLGKAINKILNLGAETVVAKMGSRGARLYRKGGSISCRHPRVEAIYTKGAGDVFNAAFLSIIYREGDMVEALERACYVAAQHVAGSGPLWDMMRKAGYLGYRGSQANI